MELVWISRIIIIIILKLQPKCDENISKNIYYVCSPPTQIQYMPILAYPNLELPFFLPTDASMAGLACILNKEQDGKRAIAYGSGTIVKRNNLVGSL